MKLKGNEIAVIGYALRFPMAKDVNEFWNNLKLGIDCISHTNDEAGDNIVKSFGKMDGIYDFDADLFKIPEHDAVSMDPQQRWLTSLSYEALENSGNSLHYFKYQFGYAIIGLGLLLCTAKITYK